MKILIKECKKIMDIRVLLVIAVFTVLFYHLFLEVTIYPAGGQTTNSPYDMPFYAELIESWGTSLPREDWSKLDEKRKELEEAYTRIIAADQVLADAKITNYQEFSTQLSGQPATEQIAARIDDVKQILAQNARALAYYE